MAPPKIVVVFFFVVCSLELLELSCELFGAAWNAAKRAASPLSASPLSASPRFAPFVFGNLTVLGILRQGGRCVHRRSLLGLEAGSSDISLLLLAYPLRVEVSGWYATEVRVSLSEMVMYRGVYRTLGPGCGWDGVGLIMVWMGRVKPLG